MTPASIDVARSAELVGRELLAIIGYLSPVNYERSKLPPPRPNP